MGKERKKHICRYSTCPCCQEYLNLYTHQCYLQPVEDEEKKRKRRQRKRGEQCLAANDPDFQPQEERPPPPPLFVYFDIEARQEGGVHMANLLCTERHDNDEQFVFEGENFLESFLDWVRELTVTEEDDRERTVICVAHNFQGYDS